jgi:hypothetical protein
VYKPTVYIDSTVELARHNIAPGRIMLALPPGGVLISETFDLRPGEPDQNLNRTAIVGVYTRRVQIMDLNNTDFWRNETIALPGAGQVQFRRFFPPLGQIGLPFDPRGEAAGNAANRNLFGAGPLTFQMDFQPIARGI